MQNAHKRSLFVSVKCWKLNSDGPAPHQFEVRYYLVNLIWKVRFGKDTYEEEEGRLMKNLGRLREELEFDLIRMGTRKVDFS